MFMPSRIVRVVGGATLLVVVAACASTTPPAATIRSSALTAPADLQLLCAGEAAVRFMVPADGVLPIASRPGAAGGTFEVDVRLPAGQALCVIDSQGTIVSLERA
jgi:hypothetical protein